MDGFVDAGEGGLGLFEGGAGAGVGLGVEVLRVELVKARAQVLAEFDFEDSFAGFEVAAGGGEFGVLAP